MAPLFFDALGLSAQMDPTAPPQTHLYREDSYDSDSQDLDDDDDESGINSSFWSEEDNSFGGSKYSAEETRFQRVVGYEPPQRRNHRSRSDDTRDGTDVAPHVGTRSGARNAKAGVPPASGWRNAYRTKEADDVALVAVAKRKNKKPSKSRFFFGKRPKDNRKATEKEVIVINEGYSDGFDHRGRRIKKSNIEELVRSIDPSDLRSRVLSGSNGYEVVTPPRRLGF